MSSTLSLARSGKTNFNLKLRAKHSQENWTLDEIVANDYILIYKQTSASSTWSPAQSGNT